MKVKNLVLVFAVGFELFFAFEVVVEMGPTYTSGDVIRAIIATSILYFALGASWCGFWMGEKEQIAKDKLRDKVIMTLRSRRKESINEAIDILNHPNRYLNNV